MAGIETNEVYELHTIMIELTEKQQQAVRNGEAVQLPAPEIGEDIVLLSASQYRALQESLQDRRDQDALLRYSMKQAARVAKDSRLAF
jgi:hypothetical protein